MRSTRRTYLTGIGGLAATALAGCSDQAGGAGTATDAGTESNDPTATDAETESDAESSSQTNGAYAGEWLVRPDALGLDDYAFTTVRPAAIMKHEEALTDGMRERFTTDIGLDGAGTLGSFDAVHWIANAIYVWEGSFDRAALTDQLTGAGFEQTETHRGHDLYRRSESAQFAVSDERFVQAGLQGTDVEVGAEAALTATLDTHAGTVERYQDVDDDCARLLSALGDGDAVIGRTEGEDLQSVEGAAAEGARWRLGEAETDVTAAVVYASADATDADAVESWASEGHPFGDATPEMTTDGRAVSASAARPTGDVTEFAVGWKEPEWSGAAPQVSFSTSYDPDAGTVTIRHDAGDTIPAADLYLVGDGFADRTGADQTSAGQWQGSTDEQGNVTAGHAVVVGVTADCELTLEYRGDQTTRLATFEGPEA